MALRLDGFQTTFIPYDPHHGKHVPAFGNGTFLPSASSPTVSSPPLRNLLTSSSGKRARQPTGRDTIQSDDRILGVADPGREWGPIQGSRVSPRNQVQDHGE